MSDDDSVRSSDKEDALIASSKLSSEKLSFLRAWVLFVVISMTVYYFVPSFSGTFLSTIVSIFLLSLLTWHAWTLYSSNLDFPISSSATVIQGSSIFLMVMQIGFPLYHIMSADEVDRSKLLHFGAPVAEALIVMAVGIALAVGLNYMGDSGKDATVDINVKDIDFGELEKGLADTAENLKMLNERVLAMGSALQTTSDHIVNVGSKSADLDKAIGQVSALVRDLDAFFVRRPS